MSETFIIIDNIILSRAMGKKVEDIINC
ncbi:hypothetical protein SCFA_780002 [anaerobic digester metagenome]|uniref:Uncharacterized protein n=1 Tax=anaerobic digester metagenome TaxID=1263854 RepID=A0A485M611_9ZZZZ